MDKEHSLSDLAGEDERLSPYLEHVDITADELNLYSRSISDILGYAWDLDTGESTSVLDENGCLYLIECTERKANNEIAVDEVKDNINKTLREERYDEIIVERAANISVECDMKQIYSFMKKNINN